jgi:hypothetical protein
MNIQQTPKLSTVSQFCADNPAFKEGGMRHLFFTNREALEKAGVICYFGRKLLIDEAAFLQFVKDGETSVIAGRAR